MKFIEDVNKQLDKQRIMAEWGSIKMEEVKLKINKLEKEGKSDFIDFNDFNEDLVIQRVKTTKQLTWYKE